MVRKVGLLRMRSIMSRMLSILIAVLLFFALVIIFRKHIADNSRLEYCARVACIGNLREIAKALADKTLHLKEENIPAIEAILHELNRQCPSGKRIHSDESLSFYQVVVLPDGHVLITENADNHDTDKMKFIDCPYVRYCLYQPSEDANEIQLGRWRNAQGAFEEIESFNNIMLSK